MRRRNMKKQDAVSINNKNRSVFGNIHIASILLVLYDIVMPFYAKIVL